LDWIVAVSTETADAFLGDIKLMKAVCEKSGAKLMLDATGSINLEADHELADICMFSSCKGLGGLTGAGFITYNKELLSNLNRSPKEFILDIDTYIQKKTTGPAHTLLSLHLIADRFEQLGVRVRESKRIFVEKYRQFLFRADNQPALCTKFRADFVNLPTGTISYKPRSIEPGSHVICHLFDQFESNRTVGDFYDAIEIR
jgi:2-aminoethylphosphonate-pyruvate transaminase